MKIIVDAFGGDHAPEEILLGCAQAMEELGVEILLSGDQKRLESAAAKLNLSEQLAHMEILHCSEVLTMEDEPGQRGEGKGGKFHGRRPESIGRRKRRCLRQRWKQRGPGGGGHHHVKRIRGVRRVSFAPILPKFEGFFMLNDGGANVDCRPEMLLQFGIMGSAYMKKVMGIENPRVGLANVGSEDHKGDELRQEALALLRACPSIRFVGNVEARDIPYDAADVVVADGFTGNMMLKLYEGVAMAVMDKMKGVFQKSLLNKLAASVVYGDMKALKKSMDYNEYGGAPIMGASKPVFKIHGSAKASTVKNALRLTRDYAQSGIIEEIARAVGKKEETL